MTPLGLRLVSPEQRLIWDLLIINQQRLHKKTTTIIKLSLGHYMLNSHKCKYIHNNKRNKCKNHLFINSKTVSRNSQMFEESLLVQEGKGIKFMFNYLSHSYRIIAHQDKYNSHKVETIKYVGFIFINHSLSVYKKIF